MYLEGNHDVFSRFETEDQRDFNKIKQIDIVGSYSEDLFIVVLIIHGIGGLGVAAMGLTSCHYRSRCAWISNYFFNSSYSQLGSFASSSPGLGIIKIAQ